MILKKEMRLYLASAALAFLAFAFPVRAAADEFDQFNESSSQSDDYQGEVDRFTDEPVGGEGSGPALENEVQLSANGVYSREMERFIYDAGNGKIYSNISDGMIVTEDVKIEVSEGINVAVYKDGKELERASSYLLDSQGEYTVSTVGQSVDLSIMRFTIVNSETYLVYRYEMPEKFYISGIKFNNEEININRSGAVLNDDGHYVISYGCPSIMKYYTLDIVVDHTAPAPTFKGVNKKNTARGPITIENVASDETMTVTLNGKTLKEKKYYKNKKYKLKDSGKYVVTVTDKAGNVTETELRILPYINLTSTIFLIAFLVVAGGVVGYLIFHRKTLKVR